MTNRVWQTILYYATQVAIVAIGFITFKAAGAFKGEGFQGSTAAALFILGAPAIVIAASIIWGIARKSHDGGYMLKLGLFSILFWLILYLIVFAMLMLMPK